jgi:hypothetical protein
MEISYVHDNFINRNDLATIIINESKLKNKSSDILKQLVNLYEDSIISDMEYGYSNRVRIPAILNKYLANYNKE